MTETTTDIRPAVAQVQARIAAACAQAGRAPGSVKLLAVSKTKPWPVVAQAVHAGLREFGENYIQEGVDKISRARAEGLALRWHCIGPIQSNKTRLVAEHFDAVHTLDRLKIAQRLSEQRPPELAPLEVFVQVNLDDGPNKSGVAPEEALALCQAVAALPRLRLVGLMAIPEPAESPEQAQAVFARLSALLAQCQAAGLSMTELSMGMSHDLESAVAAGSTWVRVGTALFGDRLPK